MFENYNDLLSVEELCEILCIGRNRAYELLNGKIVRGFRIGRTWRIPKASLEAYIVQRCRSNS